MSTWQDAIKFIRLNDLRGFSLRHGTSDNQMIFKSLADESIEDAIGRAEKIMEFCEGRYITLEGWQGSNAQRGKYTFTFQNSGQPSLQNGIVVAGTPPMDENYINDRINTAMERVRAEYQQKDLERREKELQEEKKAYEADRASVLGLLIDKLAPAIRAMQQPHARVAGTTLGESPNDRIVPYNNNDEEQVDVDIPEHIVELILRWQAVEPEMEIYLEKIVTLAERGDEKYKTAKIML